MSGGEGDYWTVAVVALPLALSIAAYVLGQWVGAAAGLVTAVIQPWAALRLAQGVLKNGPWYYSLGGWDAPLGIQLRVDGLCVLMIFLTAVVGAAVTVYACAYFNQEEEAVSPHAAQVLDPNVHFWPLILLLWASLNGLFLSADVFNVYVMLELITLASVALVALDGSAEALTAALRYLLLAILGSLAYLLGVALLYSAYAALDMATLGRMAEPTLATFAATGLMTVGLLVKAALPPLHVWLPPAHAAAPAPVSALLSALVVKAPFYLILRLWFEVVGDCVSPHAAQVLGVLGGLAIVWGAYQAWHAPRLKQVIAYSTISQIGYLFLLFPLASAPGGHALAVYGGVYYCLAHGLAKAAAFLAVGAVQQTIGHDRIRELGGAGIRAPVTFSVYGLAAVGLIGLPPAGLFAAKWLLLSAALAAGQWWYALLLLVGGALAAAYLGRFIFYALGSPAEPVVRSRPSWSLDLPALVLALASLLMGFCSNQILQLLEIGGPLFR